MVVPRGYLLIKWLLVGLVASCLTLAWHLHRAAQATVGPVRRHATGTIALTRLLQVTATGADHSARGPGLTLLSDGNVYVWWQERPAVTDLRVPFAGMVGNRKVARWTGTGFRPIWSWPLALRCYARTRRLRDFPATLRLQALPDAPGVVVGIMTDPTHGVSGLRGYYDVSFSRLLTVKDAKPDSPPFVADTRPPVLLSSAREGASGAPPAKQTFFPIGFNRTDDYYLNPEFLISRTRHAWYATGNTPQRSIWFTQSADEGQTWRKRMDLGLGGLPVVCETPSGDLLLFAIKPKDLKEFDVVNGEPLWSDDVPYEPSHPDNRWPSYGRITLRQSKDGGKTWSRPQDMESGPYTLQCRACAAPDGRIWLVSVQSVEATEQRTALSLTSSRDGGKTWDKPMRLTDGTHFDREPDLAFYGGKLRIAFTRGDRGGHTDIWLADVDLEARSNIGVEVVARPAAPYAGSAVVRSLQPEPHETPGIMSGALDNPDHTMVLYARVKPPVAGVIVHFDVHDTSPSTIAASLSRREALTDADGIAQTVVKSSNTGTPHYKARVTARVKEGDTRRAKSFAVEILLPDISFGPPRLH